ncbi:MAG: Co2+/Mg2+ efflux protein ApaG [Pseudomonadota bacterium]
MSRMTIQAEANFLPEDSDEAASRFFFVYRITIRNDGDAPAQLLNRHWWVTDGNGQVQEVHGSGVVGKQPRLAAGETFEYTSAAALETPVGAMHGYYEFVDDDGRTFEAAIPAFSLSVPNVKH